MHHFTLYLLYILYRLAVSMQSIHIKSTGRLNLSFIFDLGKVLKRG